MTELDQARVPRIEVSGLASVYEGRHVLKNISFQVHAGEILGIVGPGGHGKSVLMKHIPALLEATAGTISVDGVDVGSLDAKGLMTLREKMGYLFQAYALFDSMTVGDNVAFPLRQMGTLSEEEVERRVRERLREVGLEKSMKQFPRELSGGMKKRVALARASIALPSLMFYDDPSAGLDPVTSSRIFSLIQVMHQKVKGAISLVISHDIDRMLPLVHRWLYLLHGEVHFLGDTSALRQALKGDQHMQAFFRGSQLLKGDG